ncbi:MAG: FG-GAP repeat protein [Candidatus Eisenbacteria bacterium]
MGRRRLTGDAAVTAGDLNADGYSDLIVNAPDAISGGGGQGRVSIYLGSSSGLAATPVAVREESGRPTPSAGASSVWAT